MKLLLSLALVCTVASAQMAGMTAEEHAKMHAIPVGTGPSEDGAAWLIITNSGLYSVFNGKVLGLPTNPMYLEANRVYRIYPHSGDLEWIPPGGKREKVPIVHLLPVVARFGSGK